MQANIFYFFIERYVVCNLRVSHNIHYTIFGISFQSVSLDLHLTTHHLKYLPTYTFTTLPSYFKETL